MVQRWRAFRNKYEFIELQKPDNPDWRSWHGSVGPFYQRLEYIACICTYSITRVIGLSLCGNRCA